MVMESYYPTQALAINQGWADQAPNSYQPPGYHRCTAHLLQSVTHAWLKHKHPRSTSFPAHPCTDTHQRQNLAQKASSSSHPVYKRQEKCSVSSILPVHPAAVLVSSSACPAKLPQHCVSHWPTRDLWLQGEGRTSRSPACGFRAGGRTAFKGSSA